MPLVGPTELSRHLVLPAGREGVHRLVGKGVIERRDDGRYNLDAYLEAYIKYLRERPARGGASAALTKARSELIALRIAKARGELVPASKMQFLASTLSGFSLAVLESLAGSIPQARHDPELRRELQAWTERARRSLADQCERQAASIEASGSAVEIAWGAP
jgi:hypothetical protein